MSETPTTPEATTDAPDAAAVQDAQDAQVQDNQAKAEDAAGDSTVVANPNDNARPVSTTDAIAEPPLPPRPVSVDAQGVARVMPGYASGWEPAPSEATEDQIKAAEERNAREEELLTAQREGRVNPITGEILTDDQAATDAPAADAPATDGEHA